MDVITHFIRTRDGRQLYVVEAGKRHGVPVLVHIGTPGSGTLLDAWVEDAAARGIRLITYDRPGYGESTPQPGRTVASVAVDVAEIAEHLRLSRLLVWGISGGGPHAIACAALLPDLVAAAAALAAPAPFDAHGLDWMLGMGEDNIQEFGAALKGRDALSDFIHGQVPALTEATPSSLVAAMRTLLSPPDVAALTEENAAFLIGNMQRAVQESCSGWIDDDLAFTGPWGFDASRVGVPLLLMQGAQDLMVPPAHGVWLSRHIPQAESRMLPEDGHLTLVFRRIPEVHDWLLSKMP
ncbi:MAG TPA: alpha/beta hydrolase [Anaerolineales bacterium]|nr:alpha/beta hydrolase [Anaerolineales bacterium]